MDPKRSWCSLTLPIWIEYIDRVNPLVEAEMDMLLLAGKVATAGMVLAELRRGCRTRDPAKRMLGRLQELPFLEVDRDNWLAAGEMVSKRRREDINLGLRTVFLRPWRCATIA